MTSVPMTKEGEVALRAELERLKTRVRPDIVKAIAAAREHGDLKENAEYHAAREQQSFIEGRIQQIEDTLANSQIIDVKSIKPTGKVIFGTTVNLINEADGGDVTYRIVGKDEADIDRGLINVLSPLARALIGKMKGDFVQVQTPGGTVEYEIRDVRHL